MKHLVLIFGILQSPGVLLRAQDYPKIRFGEALKIEITAGYNADYVGERGQDWERQRFFTGETGVSLNRFLLVGAQARVVRAGTFQQDYQGFYMAGLVGQVNFWGLPVGEKPTRFNLVLKFSLLNSNFLTDYSGTVAQFLRRRNQFYLGGEGALEFRLWRGFCLRGGAQLCKNLGKSWDLHGVAFLNGGLACYFFQGKK